MAFLDHFELTSFFKTVVTAQTAPRTKPWPDPVHWAADSLGVQVENCVLVGDTTVDLRAGSAAGAQTVGVLCGFGEETELRSYAPGEILERTPQLVDLLLDN